MIHSTFVRTLVRRLGLRSIFMPFVAAMERRSLDRLGHAEVKQLQPGTLEFTGFGKTVILRDLPPSQCELGLSPHERPTMIAVLSRIPIGSTVWDVGANVGFYTRLMSAVTGDMGRVIAFEPNALTFMELNQNLGHVRNVTTVCKGLSNADGTANFATPVDHSSASRIVTTNTPMADDLTTITTSRGDTLVTEGLPVPSFIKVDVEGHELQALQGMNALLTSRECRCVLIEVHFTLLENVGQSHAPKQIRELLMQCGLTRQQWIARSHLLAERV